MMTSLLNKRGKNKTAKAKQGKEKKGQAAMDMEPADRGFFNGMTEVEEPAPVHDGSQLTHTPDQEMPEDAASGAEDDGDDDDGDDAPAEFANLTEIGAGLPVENPDEQHRYRHSSLEQRESRRSTLGRSLKARRASLATEFLTIAYLILFAIWGTLAREALASLTSFSSITVRYTSIWPNFAGTLILGFLSEGAALFRHPPLKRSIARPSSLNARPTPGPPPRETHRSSDDGQRREDQDKQQQSSPVPLHVGLAVGFCGSFTTFSGFMKDCFLSLSNSLGDEGGAASSLPGRGSGQDVMSLLAVVIVTLSVCVAGLKAGAHLAILIRSVTTKRLPRHYTLWIDRIAVLLAVGSWTAAIVLAIVPPPGSNWRGQVLFSLVFAPVGCILRFYLSIHLNSRAPAFPMGTFAANIIGTLVLSGIWNIQRSTVRGGRLSCQVQQGIIDGFCGCLTTVSTFMNELCALRRIHAYIYALSTIIAGLIIVIVVMGVMKWAAGWSIVTCTTSWA